MTKIGANLLLVSENQAETKSFGFGSKTRFLVLFGYFEIESGKYFADKTNKVWAKCRKFVGFLYLCGEDGDKGRTIKGMNGDV
jgi:hypothetical protein